MNNNLKDMKMCLWESFIDSAFYDPQAEDRLWAIIEGLDRIDKFSLK